MASTGNPRLKKYLRKFLGPTAKPLARALGTAQFVLPNPHERIKFLIDVTSAPAVQSRPDVYPFAAYLAERFNCERVITIGQPSAKDLVHLYPTLSITGFVPSAVLKDYQKQFAFGDWRDEEKLAEALTSIPDLNKSLVVCDLNSSQSDSRLSQLKVLMDHAQVCVLTTSDDDLDHVENLLGREGFNVEFIGWTAADNVRYLKSTVLAILTKEPIAKFSIKVPEDFKVVAFMAAYNEEDIIVQSIRKWTDQGVRVHVLENWSTDSTHDLLMDLARNHPVTIERFPSEGRSEFFDWGAMLARIEVLTQEIDADWFIRRGADEVLTPPWPNMSYRDAVYLVDQAGFNCIDHTIVEFHPIDDDFQMGMDHESYFKHFDFTNLSHSNQRKAWKNMRQPISSIASAGHDVLFEGRHIYPFKFLLKHYSFRSQSHAERKVFKERKARFSPKERAQGWHIHYDAIKQGHRFVQAPSDKAVYNDDTFNSTYLVERLSGVGTNRKDVT